MLRASVASDDKLPTSWEDPVTRPSFREVDANFAGGEAAIGCSCATGPIFTSAARVRNDRRDDTDGDWRQAPMTPGDPTSKRSGNPGRAVRPAPPVRPARDIRPSSSDERVQVCGYHILQIIGKGSTGTVYRAIQLSMQREVALKVLSPELARQPGFSERFVREARAAGAVHHPNVVTCYDVGNVDGVVYQAIFN